MLMFACSVSLFGQEVTVRGLVTDVNNMPLIGVTVLVEGTTTGTVTNLDGNFTLENVPPNSNLEVSYVGMTTKLIPLDGRTTLNIVLQDDTELLEELVVIGYQTIRKADLTGSVSVFNPDEMKNTIVTGSVGDALGTLPGVNVRTSGAPGREGKVEIRGTGTFGNSTPLYVVDGVVSGANRDFNFNDIESIQVLKDASAAAIYGSRAGNGVIIITTKQGAEGKMKIEVSTRATMQWLPRYNLTNRNQWIELNDLAFANAGRQPANHFDADTDWQEEVFKTGVVQDHNISFSGGGKENRYFISGNYQSNSGTTIGTQSERFTLRSNTSASRDFGDNVTFSIGENIVLSKFAVDELNTNPIIDVYRMLPTIPVFDPNNEARGGYGYGDGNRDVTFGTNPFAKEDFEDTKNTNLRVRGNLFTELELMNVLKYRFNLGFNFSNDAHSFLRKEGFWTHNQPYDPSSLNKNQAQYQGLIFDNTLEYNQSFGRSDFSAVLGTSYFSSTYEQVWGTKNDVLMTSDGRYFDTLDAALSNPRAGNFRDLEKLFSVFGRVNYNFDERYLASFTVRRDESSKFSAENRVGYFPSISAGWRISSEDFFESALIDDLKIRANYGVLGNSNIGVWDWVSFITTFPQAVFGVDQNVHTGMTQIRLANNDLRWERLTQFNSGVDLVMLNNKLELSVDYFMKETRDVLAPMQILMATGNSGGNPYVNAVTLLNTGLEFSATWRDNITSDLRYNINLNGSFLRNKIKEIAYDLEEGFTQWNTKSIPGHPIGEWYLIKTDGLFRTPQEVLEHTNSEGTIIQPNAQPGDVRFVDANDDGMITDEDRQHLGSTIPKFQLGSNIGLEYKSLDLQVQLTGAFGHKSFNGPRSAFDRFDDNSNYRADYDPWTPDNPNAKDPRPIYEDSRNVRGDQDRWLENGSYLKVRQIALGYNLPNTILGNTFQNVRVYVNAQNLITFTSYTGLDPEFLNASIWERSHDGGAYPNPFGVTFGANLTF